MGSLVKEQRRTFAKLGRWREGQRRQWRAVFHHLSLCLREELLRLRNRSELVVLEIQGNILHHLLS